jgi:hypothetical protein
VLLAVDDPLIVVTTCGRPHGGDVGAGLRLRHRERGHRAPIKDRGEPARALIVGSGKHDRCAAKALQCHDGIGKRAGAGDSIADK